MLLAEVVLSAAVMVVYFLLLFLIMGAAVLCAELEGAALKCGYDWDGDCFSDRAACNGVCDNIFYISASVYTAGDRR